MSKGSAGSLRGIKHCYMCIGIHPCENVTKMVQAKMLFQGATHVKNQFMAVANTEEGKKFRLFNYKWSMCNLCGQAFNAIGDPDETWDLTARQIKVELDSAGIDGVDTKKIKLIVADCRQSWIKLLAHRHLYIPEQQERMTFVGRLAVIITVAQQKKEKKKKGLIS